MPNEELIYLDENGQAVDPTEYSVGDVAPVSEALSGPQEDYTDTSLSRDQIEDYFEEGEIIPDLSTQENINQELAARQSNWAKAGNALAQGVVNEAILGTIESSSYMLDFPAIMNRIQGQEADFDNAIGKWARGLKEDFREEQPIYQEDPNKAWNPGDFGWYAQGLSSAFTALSFMIPGTVAALPFKALASGIKTAGVAKNILQGAGIGASALASTHMEGTMEAIATGEKVEKEYRSGKKIKKGVSPEEAKTKANAEINTKYNNLQQALNTDLNKEQNKLYALEAKYNPETTPELGKEILLQRRRIEVIQQEIDNNIKNQAKEWDKVYNDSVERAFTEEEISAAKNKAMQLNYNKNLMTMAQNVLEWTSITKGLGRASKGSISNFRNARAMHKAGEISDDAFNVARKELVKQRGKDALKAVPSEGAEEVYQTWGSGISEYQVDKEFGVKGEDRSFEQATSDIVFSEEAAAAGFFGGLGGALFQGVSAPITSKLEEKMHPEVLDAAEEAVEDVKNRAKAFDANRQAKEKALAEGDDNLAKKLEQEFVLSSGFDAAKNNNTETAIQFLEEEKEKVKDDPERVAEIDANIKTFRDINETYEQELAKNPELAGLKTYLTSNIKQLESLKKSTEESRDEAKRQLPNIKELSSVGVDIYNNELNKAATISSQKKLKSKLKTLQKLPKDSEVKQENTKLIEDWLKQSEKELIQLNAESKRLATEERSSKERAKDNEVLKGIPLTLQSAELDARVKNIDTQISANTKRLADLTKPSFIKQTLDKIASNKLKKEELKQEKALQIEKDQLNVEMQDAINKANTIEDLQNSFNEIGSKAEDLSKEGLDKQVVQAVFDKFKSFKKENKDKLKTQQKESIEIDQLKKDFDKYPINTLRQLQQRIKNKEETRTELQTKALDQVIEEKLFKASKGKEGKEKIFNIPERLDKLDTAKLDPRLLNRLKALVKEGKIKQANRVVEKAEEKEKTLPNVEEEINEELDQSKKEIIKDISDELHSSLSKEEATEIKEVNPITEETKLETKKTKKQEKPVDTSISTNNAMELDNEVTIPIEETIEEGAAKIEEEDSYTEEEITPVIEDEDEWVEIPSEDTKIEPEGLTEDVNTETIEDDGNDEVEEIEDASTEELTPEDEPDVEVIYSREGEKYTFVTTGNELKRYKGSVDLVTSSKAIPIPNIYKDVNGNPIEIKSHKLYDGSIKVGHKIEYVLLNTESFSQLEQDKVFDEGNNKTYNKDNWEHTPIFIKDESGDYIGILYKHSTNYPYLKRQLLTEKLKDSNTVKVTGEITKINPGSINSVFMNIKEDKAPKLQNAKTVFGDNPILVLSKGNIKSKKGFFWEAPNSNNEEVTDDISKTQAVRTSGKLGIAIKDNKGNHKVVVLATQNLTTGVANHVIDNIKSNNKEVIDGIVFTNSAEDIAEFYDDFSKYLEIADDINYLSYYSPAIGKVIKFNNKELLKALNAEPGDSNFWFSIFDTKEVTDSNGTTNENYTPTDKKGLKRAVYDKGVENDLREFLKTKRLDINGAFLNKPTAYVSKITNDRYDNYWQYLTSEKELLDIDLQPNRQTKAIVLTNSDKINNSYFNNASITVQNVIVEGGTKVNEDTQIQTNSIESAFDSQSEINAVPEEAETGNENIQLSPIKSKSSSSLENYKNDLITQINENQSLNAEVKEELIGNVNAIKDVSEIEGINSIIEELCK